MTQQRKLTMATIWSFVSAMAVTAARAVGPTSERVAPGDLSIIAADANALFNLSAGEVVTV